MGLGSGFEDKGDVDGGDGDGESWLDAVTRGGKRVLGKKTTSVNVLTT